MVVLIISVLIIVALKLFADAVFAQTILSLIALATISTAALTVVLLAAKKDKWVLLRKANGEPPAKTELTFCAIAAVCLVGVLLWCVHAYTLITGAVITLGILGRKPLWDAVKGWYGNKCKRKVASIKAAAKNTPSDTAEG